MVNRPSRRRLFGACLALAVAVGAGGPPVLAEDSSMPMKTAKPPPDRTAASLDREGRLSEALPLYQARAEATATTADRLRYAGALLRLGQTDAARTVYDRLVAEAHTTQHGGERRTDDAGVCASSLLLAGFPRLAVEYASAAFRERPNDPSVGLLLVRARAAAGDAAGARRTIAEVDRHHTQWLVGQRLELARWYQLTGDRRTALRLLDGGAAEPAAQMVRDSILADASLTDGSWAKASDMLAGAARKAPAGLDGRTVDRAWRNLQREMRSIHLRRAVSLSRQGKRDAATTEAQAALETDEEYVRSAAVVLLASVDLVEGRRPDALARLRALAGHDPRFASSIVQLEAALAGGADAAEATASLRATIAAEDRSADFITRPLAESLAEAVRTGSSAGRPAAASRAP